MLGIAQLRQLSQKPEYAFHVTWELLNYKPQSQADEKNFIQFLTEISLQDTPLSKHVLDQQPLKVILLK